MAKFQAAGIQPFGVNPAGVEAHASYVKKLRFNFPLLSDPDRAIARAYHALKDDGKGIQRSVYVVRSEEHTSELQSRLHLVCRLLLEKKKQIENCSIETAYLSAHHDQMRHELVC